MKKAFTLIELLIVVAIIAILAAIAVPNFLEAQVRSKVSRARTDMRSAATALEAYAVDNNKYPPMLGGTPGQPQNQTNGYGQVRFNGWRGLPHQITTPISYITSVPQDVFKQGAVANLSPNINQKYNTGNPFDMTFIYHNIRQYVDEIGGAAWNEGDINDYGLWRMFSLGPDKKYNPIGTSDTTLGWIYDPTNGTVSTGFILRTQKDTVGENFTRF